MPAGYIHHCPQCPFHFQTNGPWEFYRDDRGHRQPYGHPVPMSEEAEEAGIAGSFAEMYCPSCDKVLEVVLHEYEVPGDITSLPPGDPAPPRCPECGGQHLIFEPEPGLACPQCGQGEIHGDVEYIS